MNKVVLPNEIMLGEVSRLLSEGHEVVIMTKGSSMLPFIRGEKDSVNLVRRETVEPGDIVLAQLRPGRYVLHRVAAVDGDHLTLHGDGNLRGDEHCSIQDVSGTAVQILTPKGRVKDCICEASKRRARRWNSLPYFIRRYTLAIYRRLI